MEIEYKYMSVYSLKQRRKELRKLGRLEEVKELTKTIKERSLPRLGCKTREQNEKEKRVYERKCMHF
jgi:hypothetical protein